MAESESESGVSSHLDPVDSDGKGLNMSPALQRLVNETSAKYRKDKARAYAARARGQRKPAFDKDDEDVTERKGSIHLADRKPNLLSQPRKRIRL